MSDAASYVPDLVQALERLLGAARQQRSHEAVRTSAGPPLLTIEEAARRLRVSRMTVDRAIKAGEFPVIKFRGTYRLPAAFLDRMLADADAGAQVVVEDYAADWLAEHGLGRQATTGEVA